MINLLETKKLKEQINNSPEKVLEIIETTDMGICITDDKGFFKAVNKAYTEIYEFDKDMLIGQHFSMVLPETDKKTSLVKLHDKFIEDRYEIIRNWEVMRKDGTVLKIQADAGFSDKIFGGGAHKITFVKPL